MIFNGIKQSINWYKEKIFGFEKKEKEKKYL
jgi:hypothetical protein